MNAIELSPKDPAIAQIIRATFPKYRKKKVYLRAAESVTLSDLNWSGGTRSEYRACTLDGRSAGGSAEYSQFAPWNNPAEGVTLPSWQSALPLHHYAQLPINCRAIMDCLATNNCRST